MFAFAIWDRARAAAAARARPLRREAAVRARARRRAAVRLRADGAARRSGRSCASSTRPRSTRSSCSRYVPGPGTIVPGVRQLPPGHLLTLGARAAGGRDERRWWSPPARAPCARREPFDVAGGRGRASCSTRVGAHAPDRRRPGRRVPQRRRRLDARRRRSRRRRPRSGCKTFTVGYDVGRGQRDRAGARAWRALLGTEHHEVTLTQADVAERAPARARRARPAARRPALRRRCTRSRSSRARASPSRSAARARTSCSAATRATAGSNARARVSGGAARRRRALARRRSLRAVRAAGARLRGRPSGSRRRRCSSATSTG